MRTRGGPTQDLRIAIECLPERTRVAMLDGVRENPIIVGAYTDPRGGVCPMLAAHRRGGRTSLGSFARAWDRYTGARGRARRATERELRTLTTMLEASLAGPAFVAEGSLARAVSSVKAARRAELAGQAAATSQRWLQGLRRPRRAEGADAGSAVEPAERQLERV